MPAYLMEVHERWRRYGLAELRTGVHWGAEERDRLRGPACRPRAECAHCAAAGRQGLVEDTQHILFDCVLYEYSAEHAPNLSCSLPLRAPRPPALSSA